MSVRLDGLIRFSRQDQKILRTHRSIKSLSNVPQGDAKRIMFIGVKRDGVQRTALEEQTNDPQERRRLVFGRMLF